MNTLQYLRVMIAGLVSISYITGGLSGRTQKLFNNFWCISEDDTEDRAVYCKKKLVTKGTTSDLLAKNYIDTVKNGVTRSERSQISPHRMQVVLRCVVPGLGSYNSFFP